MKRKQMRLIATNDLVIIFIRVVTVRGVVSMVQMNDTAVNHGAHSIITRVCLF